MDNKNLVTFLFYYIFRTMLLMGPMNQLKKMFDPTRLIATIVFIVSLFSFVDSFKKIWSLIIGICCNDACIGTCCKFSWSREKKCHQ